MSKGAPMPEDGFDYPTTYSAMADEELLELARESTTLLESAQSALQNELDRRGLKPEPEKGSTEDADSSFCCPKCVRGVNDPLTCGECSTMICRVCGTALRMPEDVELEEIEPENREPEALA